MLRQPKRTERLRKLYATLGQSGMIRKKRELIRSYLERGKQVVFLIPQRALKDEREQLDGGFRFVLLRRWDVPIKSPPEKWGLYQVMLNGDIP